MPTYDYRCEENGRTLEVFHHMQDRIRTWGELCRLLGIGTDGTPAEAQVHKVLSGGGVVKSENLGSGMEPPCATGPCCGGGLCEM